MAKQKVASQINLERLAGGAFAEKLNEALMQVAENIQNPNTEATTKRQINIAIKFAPNKKPSGNQHTDLRHDQARSHGGDRHSNGDGRQHENRTDRDRRV